jgi:hypothetical protein
MVITGDKTWVYGNKVTTMTTSFPEHPNIQKQLMNILYGIPKRQFSDATRCS